MQSSDPINIASDSINATFDPINKFADPIIEQLYQAIIKDGTLSYAAYGEQIGVSEATIKRRLGELKKAGLIVRVGANKGGHWEIQEYR
ncbi:MAG: Lrp/AsnC family transcriptional regulator [Bacteroidaceae bacterium]|nr:Lrp/AsnC family transcriptional regulator [Bacteroidaceae bacterium]